MLNYFILVIWNYTNDKTIHSFTFYIELCTKSVGMALLKDNSRGDPQFVFFFSKGITIVHEIKIKIKIFNIRLFNM